MDCFAQPVWPTFAATYAIVCAVDEFTKMLTNYLISVESKSLKPEEQFNYYKTYLTVSELWILYYSSTVHAEHWLFLSEFCTLWAVKMIISVWCTDESHYETEL